MKTKRIRTKKEKTILILDFIVLAICVIRVAPNFRFFTGAIEGFLAYKSGPLTLFLMIFYMIWAMLLMLFIKNFLIIAIYMAYRIPKSRMIKENTKYEVIENIDYYRERFKNITPAEISLLTDLEIETKKDISASILNLYNKKVLSFDGSGKMIVDANADTSNLKNSDKYLFSLITNNNLNTVSINEWKSIAEKEAIEDGYIVDKNAPKTGSFVSSINTFAKLMMILFASALIGGAYLVTPVGQKLMNEFEEYDKIADEKSNKEITELIKTDKDFSKLTYDLYVRSIPIAIVGTFTVTSLFLLFAMPLYAKARSVTYKMVDENDKYERSSEGKLLVEQIAGMKNFIHDFSNLSQSEKEQVVLWNDFIIYAILLEENEKIINEIFQVKNMNLNVLNSANISTNKLI